jgi:hypothetical protein
VSGDSTAYTAMAQQQARLARAQQAHLERRFDRSHSEGDDRCAEALGCPRCHRSFDLGDSCPDCEVYLVSCSMVDQVEVESIHHVVNRRQQIFDVFVLTLITTVAVSGWFYYLWGGRWR